MQTAVPYKPSRWLLEVDAVHPFNRERYMPEGRTFEDLRLKHALFGSSELVLISDAETLRIVHPYELELRNTKANRERYLLLKKLYDRNLSKTAVFANCVAALERRCNVVAESRNSRRRTVCFSPTLVNCIDIGRWMPEDYLS